MAGNGESIFRRLMRAIGRGDLESDPGLAQNEGRVARVAEIDAAIIGEWTAARGMPRSSPRWRPPACPWAASTPWPTSPAIHNLARGMIVQTADADGHTLKVPGIVPKLGATPGPPAHARSAPGRARRQCAGPRWLAGSGCERRPIGKPTRPAVRRRFNA